MRHPRLLLPAVLLLLVPLATAQAPLPSLPQLPPLPPMPRPPTFALAGTAVVSDAAGPCAEAAELVFLGPPGPLIAPQRTPLGVVAPSGPRLIAATAPIAGLPEPAALANCAVPAAALSFFYTDPQIQGSWSTGWSARWSSLDGSEQRALALGPYGDGKAVSFSASWTRLEGGQWKVIQASGALRDLAAPPA